MDRRVVWTETAWSDLEQVVAHIAKDSSHYAAAFTREARNASRSLPHFSNRGRAVPEFNNPTVREVFVGSYRLLFTVSKNAAYILGFIHGARDLKTFWQRQGRPRA
ncbi:MAG: type II toxin-antitoxin system RelE/ParE family toxin [Terriglobia bacterium]|jgi:plasmid stabilization system protein ParE